VELTIHTPDLNENDWRRLYRRVWQEWQDGPRYQKLGRNAAKILDVVQRLGGVPRQKPGRAAFWKEVLAIVNAELAHEPPSPDQREDDSYADWHSVYRAYKRNKKKERWAAGIVSGENNPAR
jgi:hypothetical protein